MTTLSMLITPSAQQNWELFEMWTTPKTDLPGVKARSDFSSGNCPTKWNYDRHTPPWIIPFNRVIRGIIRRFVASVAERFRQSTLMPEERKFESSCSAARPSPRVNGESSAHWPLSVEALVS
ncbi:hypothetical protein TYRP_020124 [Tyrophagus putrescentiae]|nr:hypothetical protein TYRP_020124 [Tyrophagus putrescentiae]